jgi:serine phosphatase RsbU (regulator of sigma subunit)
MLKLRDFLHLPQLDPLVEKLVADDSGLVVLAGINARQGEANSDGNAFMPSGLSAIFNILLQEILLAHPLQHAVVIAEEKTLARVPRQISRRVRWIRVEPPYTYAQQIEQAARQRPGLLVIDHLDADSAPALFRAARDGVRVLAQLDTVLRGAATARQFIDLGVPREHLSALHWVLTAQRMAVLCEHCKQPVEFDDGLIEKLCARYPHLRPICGEIRQAAGHVRERAVQKMGFYRAGSCEKCHGSGYSGDITLFDLFQNDSNQEDFFQQRSLLSLEEYALRIASEGQLDLGDLLDVENDHLRRTYHLLTSSEQALTQANAELSRKLVELEASNRVLVQRTEVLMSLQDLGQLLISSSDLSELATRTCRRASDLVGADRAILYLRRLEENGEEAVILAVRGFDSGLVWKRLEANEVFFSLDDRRVHRFLHTPPGVGDPRTPRGDNERAVMGLRVPLYAQEQLVGLMIVQSTRKDFLTPGETALLQTFANQAALAIQRAGLVEELKGKINQLEAAQVGLVRKERLERELELARQVQQSMLPHAFPQIPGYTLSARYEPARQVGGDFYDMFLLDKDHFGIVVADVADKGMPAALYMALTRSLLLAEARRVHSPREALLNVNHLLMEVGDLNGFVSVFYGVVDCFSRQMIYCRAGHERPLLLRDGEVQTLQGMGAVLGILDGDDLILSEENLELAPGDRLLLYTDGLTDVINEEGNFLGLERLEDLVREQARLPAEEYCQQVFDILHSFRGDGEQFDDMTLLVLEVE